MVRDDGKQWLLELTQSITSQLKEDRADITSIWDTIHRNKELHITCREQVLERYAKLDKELTEKFANLDKRIEIAMFKIGSIIVILTIVGNHLITYLLGS